MFQKTLTALSGLALISATLTGCATDATVHATGITVSDGWVRAYESSVVDGMTGAFAQITNHTDKDVALVGGSSEIAMMTEVHEVVMLDGAMKMQPKDGGILIKAGETVTLEPGGLHVMLMGLKKAIVEGDEVTLTLDFDGAEDQTITWPAKSSMSGDEEYEPKS